MRAVADLQKSDIQNGIRMVAQTILFPIVITILFKRSDLFAIGLLGTLFTARTDPGGNYRLSVRTMAIGACLLIISNLLATLAGNTPYLMVLLILIWSFGARMLSAFGSRGARLGSIAIISFIIFLSTPADISMAWLHIAVITLGALWTIAIKCGTGLVRRHQPIRDAVADYYHALCSLPISKHPKGNSPGRTDHHAEAVMRNHIVAQRRRNMAYLMIRDLKGHYNPTTWKMYLLLKKADTLSAERIALSECIEAISLENQPAPLQAAVDRALEVADSMLLHVAECVQHARSVGDMNDLELVLQELTNGVPASLTPETGDYVTHANAHNLFRLLKQYMQTVQSVVSICNSTEPKVPAKVEKPQRRYTPVADAWRSLTSQMTMRSQLLRHSVRLSITLALATSISICLQIPHGYWMTLTVAIILKPDFQATWQRALQRVGGTVAGGTLAFVIVAMTHSRMIFFLFIVVFLFLAAAYYQRHYGMYAFFWTPVIVFLINLDHAGDWAIALQRIANTFAGGTLALIAIGLFLPLWEQARLPDQIAKTLSSNNGFLRAILVMYSGENNRAIDIEQVRQQANHECINAVSALMRLSSEPRSKQDNFEAFRDLIFYNQKLCNVLTVLSVHPAQHSNSDTLSGVHLLLEQTGEVLHSIEVAVLSRQPPEYATEVDSHLATARAGMPALMAAILCA
jgi:uncharacterized membrane protein YccC